MGRISDLRNIVRVYTLPVSKARSIILTLSFSMLLFGLKAQDELGLWYRTPAREWTDAMPLGNGRLGAMVFGRPELEHIQLNEESLWAGSKLNNNNPFAKDHLPLIQQALFSGQYEKAWDMADMYLLGTPPEIRSYQPLGDLYINYLWPAKADSYRRSLLLNQGISRTTYSVGENKIVQEVFVSAPHDVVVFHVKATRRFDTEVFLTRQRDVDEFGKDRDLVWFNGQICDDENPKKGPGGKHMRFSAAMKILSTDGQVVPVAADTSSGFIISGAKTITLILTASTDYNLARLDTDPGVDPLATCRKLLAEASLQKFANIRAMHEKDHRSYFDRVKFMLGNEDHSATPTDERLARLKAGAVDRGLVALYYQYGRYLLMASSRKPGRLPANLQGIWNDQFVAKWNSDFHTNINLQMNYWPAGAGNLPEASGVLANFIKQLTIPGSATAREMYGAEGWTLHHLTDVFGRTGVADGVWGFSPLAGAWMTFPVYDHYEFTRDKAYLKDIAYPVIRGSVQFVLDFLIESPEGYLVTNPSHSPENPFVVPGTGGKEKAYLSYAATIDIQIIRGLFRNFLECAQTLETDQELVAQVIAAERRLPPMKVGRNGTLQEWIHDYEEFEPGHRHISHLLGLYPLDLISPEDPVLFEAAKRTIERRLAYSNRHVGWSSAWIINFYARLLDGEKAGQQVQRLLQYSTLSSLLNTIPPFQIDGNLGGAAGIAEMLLQSHGEMMHILPALPASWDRGAIRGLCARGGYRLDFAWRDGKLRSLMIDADRPGARTIRYGDTVISVNLKKGKNKFSGNTRLFNN